MVRHDGEAYQEGVVCSVGSVCHCVVRQCFKDDLYFGGNRGHDYHKGTIHTHSITSVTLIRAKGEK